MASQEGGRAGGGGGGGEGYRSRFTENKTARLNFTKNMTLVFHTSRKIKENVLEITVHGDYESSLYTNIPP